MRVSSNKEVQENLPNFLSQSNFLLFFISNAQKGNKLLNNFSTKVSLLIRVDAF